MIRGSITLSIGIGFLEPITGNKRAITAKDPLMRIVHTIVVGAFVHRTRSRERCQKPDSWLMSMMEEGRFANVAWILAEYLCKKASGIKVNSEICRGHYVTKIVKSLGLGSEQRSEPSGLDSNWGDWNASLNEIERRDVWRDVMLMRNGYMLDHSMPILHHLDDQANYTYPTYEPPNVPPQHGLGYEMGGPSRGVQDDDDDMSNQMVRLEDCVESGDDMDD
ncbi:hypothetical protein Tco_1296753 [Tanacetum coccineum]